MKITDVRARYPIFDPPGWNWRRHLGPVCVEVHTDEGIHGVGLGAGGLAALPVVNGHLREHLIGRDPTQIEALWDELYWLTTPYGRAGLAMMAISGIDLALWDVRAKSEDRPVYRLLAPHARAKAIPVYLTGPDVAAAADRHPQVDLFKITMCRHTGESGEGLTHDVRRIREALETLGPDRRLAVDAWCLWSDDYAARVLDQVGPERLAWLEDPLRPDDLAGYRRLHGRFGDLPLAVGNFETGPEGLRRLLEAGFARILQPDVSWVGGLTPTLRAARQAAERGVQLIPHRGGEAWGLHLATALGLAPAEFVLRDDGSVWIDPPVTSAPDVAEGAVTVRDAPGFGVEFHPDLRWQMSTEVMQ